MSALVAIVRAPWTGAVVLALAGAALFLVPPGPWRSVPLVLGWAALLASFPRAGLLALALAGAAPFLLSAAWVDGRWPGTPLLYTLADLAPQHRLPGDPWTAPPLYGDSPMHYAVAPAWNAAAWAFLACAGLPFLRRRPSAP